MKRKNAQLENEVDHLRRQVESSEMTCRIKQLEFETGYVKDVEHKLIRSKQ